MIEFALVAWRFVRPGLALLRVRWKEAAFVLVVMALAVAWFSFRGEHRARLKAQAELAALVAQEKAAGQRARRVEAAQAGVSTAAGKREAAAQVQIRTVYQTLAKEVPSHVSPAADARCVVPVGFVRVFDTGAAGVSGLPGPASQPDDAASGVALSGVAAAILANDAAAAANAEQLSGLQAWVRDQAAAAAQ